MSVKINDEVASLSKRIIKDITIDKTTGIGKAADSIYESTLPESITMDTVKAVNTHNHNFTAAAIKAYGELSTEVLKSNTKLDMTEISIPFNDKDTLNASHDRVKEVRNPGTGEKTDVAGKISVSIKSYVGSNKGQVSSVRKAIEEHAAEVLAKK